MKRCVVIQPFDGGDFDARFGDTIKPAIKKAGLEAYRVDNDPSVRIPIKAIETNIQDAAICLADITTDNPNVWYELGYAYACKKDVVLICSKARTSKYPFDIAHRSIIPYSIGSKTAFKNLSKAITDKIVALLKSPTIRVPTPTSDATASAEREDYEMVLFTSLLGLMISLWVEVITR